MIKMTELEKIYMDNYREYFSSLSPISDEIWEFYKQFVEVQYLKKGEFFTKVGSPGNVYGYVAKGLLKQYFTTYEGKEYITAFTPHNRMVSDYVSLIKEVPARTDIIALEDCTLLTIARVGSRQEMGLIATLEAVGRRLAEIRYIEKEDKEWDFLCLEAKDRYKKFCKDKADIIERLSQTDIASYLGISNVSLSRIRSSLNK